MKKTRIRRISKKRSKQMKKYMKQRSIYLAAFPNCAVCGLMATEIHHTNGRNGDRLLDESFWKGLCLEHHRYAHNNPAKATAMGLFAKPGIPCRY